MRITTPGIALFAAALMFSTSALAQKVTREGVIISHSGDSYNVRTREGPLTVVTSPGTEIREVRGISKRTKDARSLIPGLIIKAEGEESGGTLHAVEIEYKDRDWRAAVASKAGNQEALERQAAINAKAAAERAALKQAIIDGNEYIIRDEVTVLFAVGSTVVRPEYKQQLLAAASKAPSHGNYRVSILGFADPTGNAAANERLSQKRALAVSNFLRQSGHIQPGRVLSPSAMGEGTAAPGEAAPASNEEARRVLVRIVTPKSQLQ